ncbi:MAG: hypothetical protein AB2814_09090 [Candidatus Sedimenticola endophacoides]
MRNAPLLAGAALALSVTCGYPVLADGDANGREVFESLCLSCHPVERTPTLSAPPIFAVKNHYLRTHPTREAFIARLSTWLERPDPNASLMPGALRRFGTMPRQELNAQQRRAVAAVLYDTPMEQPGWYREHYRKEHGK